MAPWLIENGGTGIVPQPQPQLSEGKKELKSERKGKPGRADWRQIKPSQVRAPSSSEEAVKMIMLAERMLELGLETRGASSTDVNLLKISTGVVLHSLL